MMWQRIASRRFVALVTPSCPNPSRPRPAFGFVIDVDRVFGMEP
jgi:hypothetical protein